MKGKYIIINLYYWYKRFFDFNNILDFNIIKIMMEGLFRFGNIVYR